jgi:hypothetical protein
MTGVHKRIGQVHKPNKELTIDVLHSTDKILEDQWACAQTLDKKKRITEMGTCFEGGFCTGLHGEEMLLLELTGTTNSLVHLDDEVNAHFKFVILGRTKGNQILSAKFGVPCLPVTEGTNLRHGWWVNGWLQC